MIYVIQFSLLSACSQAVSKLNCPKHVEFYSKNKFAKLMHLVGFIIRMSNCVNGNSIIRNVSYNHMVTNCHFIKHSLNVVVRNRAVWVAVCC